MLHMLGYLLGLKLEGVIGQWDPHIDDSLICMSRLSSVEVREIIHIQTLRKNGSKGSRMGKD